MIPAVTEDVFRAVMGLIENNDTTEIFSTAKNMELRRTPELAAQTYVAYLKLTGNDFPEIKKTKYSVTIADSSPYFAFYRVASCCGIGVKQIKKLYDSTLLPEIIITHVDDPVVIQTPEPVKPKDLPEGIEALTKKRGVQCSEVKNMGVLMLSTEAKAIRKKGGVVSVYKVIYKGKASFINVIQYKGETSYDINSFYCKDANALVKEFNTRNRK